MPYRSSLVVLALLTLFFFGVATAPVAARSRTPGVSADEDDDGGDEEIDSATAHGNQKGEYGVGTDTDVDELISAPAHQNSAGPRDVTDGLPENQEDMR